MSGNKNINWICAVIVMIVMVITVLFMNGEKLGITKITDYDTDKNEDEKYFSDNDLNSSWDTSDATIICLQNNAMDISGNGAYELNGNLIIASAGKYVLSGTLSDGSVVIDANDNSKVFVLLDGVEISSSNNAPIVVENADKVFLTLAEDSKNILHLDNDNLSDSITMVNNNDDNIEGVEMDAVGDSDDEEDVIKGVIYSHDDLTINGTGSLQIDGGYKHGIVSNDDLVIAGGDIRIEALCDGIHVNDKIRITSVNLTINCGDDGIHADEEIYIEDGSIEIEKCYEGIESKDIIIQDGDINIVCEDDGINAGSGEADMFGGFGGFGGGTPPNGMPGKWEDDGRIRGGNNEALSEESTLEKKMGKRPDDGGRIDFMHERNSDEMPQDMGTPPNMRDKQDMGIPPEMGDKRDMEMPSEVVENITINGGKITIVNSVSRDADGIDSNGNIYINGGEISITLLQSPTNEALDYGSERGGVCEINGGTVTATIGNDTKVYTAEHV